MASRTPMASATAPPTPVSTSSNTSVGAEPRSASTTLSANRKRASSPPDATFISGPGRVPGLVCTQNSTRSMPFGPAAAASLSIWVENCARSSLSGLSSPFTALSRLPAALARNLDSASAASRYWLGGADGRLQRLEPLLAGVDQRDIGLVAGGERGQFVHRRIVFAAGGAQRKQPFLNALELGWIESAARSAASRWPRVSSSALSAASSAFTVGSINCGACVWRRSRRRMTPDSAGTEELAPAMDLMRVAQILGHLLALHHDGASLG